MHVTALTCRTRLVRLNCILFFERNTIFFDVPSLQKKKENGVCSPFQGSVTITTPSSNLNLMALRVIFARKNKRETRHSGSISCNVRASLSQRHLEEPVRPQTLTLHPGGNKNLRLGCSIKTGLRPGGCPSVWLRIDSALDQEIFIVTKSTCRSAARNKPATVQIPDPRAPWRAVAYAH